MRQARLVVLTVTLMVATGHHLLTTASLLAQPSAGASYRGRVGNQNTSTVFIEFTMSADARTVQNVRIVGLADSPILVGNAAINNNSFRLVNDDVTIEGRFLRPNFASGSMQLRGGLVFLNLSWEATGASAPAPAPAPASEPSPVAPASEPDPTTPPEAEPQPETSPPPTTPPSSSEVTGPVATPVQTSPDSPISHLVGQRFRVCWPASQPRFPIFEIYILQVEWTQRRINELRPNGNWAIIVADVTNVSSVRGTPWFTFILNYQGSNPSSGPWWNGDPVREAVAAEFGTGDNRTPVPPGETVRIAFVIEVPIPEGQRPIELQSSDRRCT